MTNKVWNLMYKLGNTDRTVGDSENPQTKAKALEGAAVISRNGWRVWVEHSTSGKRIFENDREKLHREGEEAQAAHDSTQAKIPPAAHVDEAGLIAQIRQLANQLARQRQTPLAVVLVEPTEKDYDKVAPQLLLEDAFCAANGRWPSGFSLTLMNEST